MASAELSRRVEELVVWESADAAKRFFSEEMRERVTGLYGVEPMIELVEIAQMVDNSGASHQECAEAARPTPV
jgi:hypothetical protein